jgi:hypothetical protein
MSEKEASDMILWRPIFDGLVEGIESDVSTSECGVGCFIQRASILALRAILLRHADSFSTSQIVAIMKNSIIPYVQRAAENDKSPVVSITSESPLISNIDFLVEAMPLPPDRDDVALRHFEKQNNTLSRSWGPAELMLEASFTDLRYGGDGDLRKAHTLAKKAIADSSSSPEQPFPDSWIATTASMALGLLTDIAIEFAVLRGPEARDKIWSIVSNQYKLWYLGHESTSNQWSPCEALVRIASAELHRLSERLATEYESSTLQRDEQAAWSSIMIHLFSDFLAQSLDDEESLRLELLHYGMKKSKAISDEKKNTDVETAFGNGKLVESRKQADTCQQIDVISLEFGGVLYRPAEESKTNGVAMRSVKALRRDRSDASDDNGTIYIVCSCVLLNILKCVLNALIVR